MRNLRGLTVVALIALMTVLQLPVRANEKYHMVMVPNPTDQMIRTMQELGLPMDDAHQIKGQGIEIPLSESDLALLTNQGIPFHITRFDLEKYYGDICRLNMLSIPGQVDTDPVHMKYGSMGGFYNWTQIVADLDSMHLLYPSNCATKVSLGQGWNANPLWMVKISNSPSANNGKPEGEWDATIHCREPGSYTTLMYAMWWLLENYGTDAEATYLVNNRQLYFVPMVNPDGWLYNQQTNPGGGGMWRKNRRFNNPSYGVDCNRNFSYQWGYDNFGSSPTPSSETYRGPSAGSEPETQAIMNFISAHNIKVSNSMHTFAGVMLCPYGYSTVLPPVADYNTFMEYMSASTAASGYNFGPLDSPIMYAVNGGSVDWGYHDAHSMAMTVEVGTVGFWPSIGYIMPDAQANLPGLLYQFWIAGARLEGTELNVSDGYLTPGQTDNLVATIINQGQSSSEPFTYELTTSDPYITLTPNVVSSDSLLKRTTTTNSANPFVAQVAANCPVGHTATFNLLIHQGTYTRTKPYNLIVGTPMTLFSDDAESGITNWTATSGWGLATNNSHSPTHSFADSPTGTYSSNTTRYLTLNNGLSLSGINTPWLEFYTRWEIEAGYDFAQVEVSINNGSTWTALGGLYTNLGISQGVQPVGQPIYDGAQYAWVREHMDLSAYAGQTNVKFRFKLRSDGGFNLDGWYVDDIKVFGFTGTAPPAMDVTITAVNPPITIPANGGSFQYNINAHNLTSQSQTFSIWNKVRDAANVYTQVFGPVTRTLPGNANPSRILTQNIAGSISSGTLHYISYIGTYPSTIQDSSFFTITKSAVADGGPWISESYVSGDVFDEYAVNSTAVPSEYSLGQNYPNPFNPLTSISFSLPQAELVKLTVFDVMGREVATLVNGMREAGLHSVTFDASTLASGVYLYKLQAGDFTATNKMVLLK
ncbi:MAG: M14 family zinc carboxypeptidase [bacterium]|nr:M14 family zinc carboxypeptidase [bacterium]